MAGPVGGAGLVRDEFDQVALSIDVGGGKGGVAFHDEVV